MTDLRPEEIPGRKRFAPTSQGGSPALGGRSRGGLATRSPESQPSDRLARSAVAQEGTVRRNPIALQDLTARTRCEVRLLNPAPGARAFVAQAAWPERYQRAANLRCQLRARPACWRAIRDLGLGLVGVVLGFAAAGCGGEQEASSTSDLAASRERAGARDYQGRRRGYTVAVPGGWHLATASLTASISDPREILAVATFLLGRGDGVCDALERVPPGEGVRDRPRTRPGRLRPRGFSAPARQLRARPRPPRLVRVGPTAPPPSRTVRGVTSHRSKCSTAGSGSATPGAFHVFVGVGKTAPPEVRREAFKILNSLRFDPTGKPDWEASE